MTWTVRSDFRFAFGFPLSDFLPFEFFFTASGLLSLGAEASATSVFFESLFTTSTVLGGRKRSAALGIFKTLSRCATMIETLAVMPGLSFKFGLVTSMIVS